MTEQTSRERFEARLTRAYPRLSSNINAQGKYVVKTTQEYWEVWQAAEAGMQSRIDELNIKLLEAIEAYGLMRDGLNALTDRPITGNQADDILAKPIPKFIKYDFGKTALTNKE